MSRSHNFFLQTSIKEFPDELLEAMRHKVKHSNLVRKSLIDKKHLFVCFNSSSPDSFFLTTIQEDSMLAILDKACFSFCKYENGRYNQFFCELALLCKYFLGKNLTLTSDGLEDRIDADWRKAQEQLNEEGRNILLMYEDKLRIYIDDREVNNVFDEDGAIFNAMINRGETPM